MPEQLDELSTKSSSKSPSVSGDANTFCLLFGTWLYYVIAFVLTLISWIMTCLDYDLKYEILSGGLK